VMALYLQNQPNASPSVVHDAITTSATAGRVTDAGTGSPNRLLFSGLYGQPPASPLNVSAVVISSAHVDVTWADASAVESSFEIARRQRDASGTWAAWQVIGTSAADAVVFADTVASPLAVYRYRIRACNAAGCSAWLASNIVTTPDTGLPATPPALSALALSSTMVFIGWPDVHGETHYRLQRARSMDGVWSRWDLVAWVDSNSTSVTDASLTALSTYRYRIQACNTNGCSPYRTVRVTTPLSGPSAVSATPVSPTQINLAWNDVVGESHYQVQRRTRTAETWGVWTSVTSRAANVTSYSDMGLSAATTYRHRVRACNAEGCSAWVAGPSVRTPT
jgi:hypothetical protein